ncbi:MFS transporter [Actinacidiphila paucisporea]|uniref:Predicted arabinose efflux permease, MFS family n=1 Tax=Actinacidiphila paucisporea TaxID=310782 RepID=A0A1M7PWQ7_9ACTN|nr:MFS transporter [Actinacidiphila paucisporea]SHN22123.1 Predicted arabinose efflux permease, MFS family [Actinacidiphila paucisporea]
MDDDARPQTLRHGRAALAVSFFAQGALFALLVTRIPAIQDRYGISDGLLPVFLAAVPILAGLGSVATEQLVKRVRPSVVLRWVQPLVALVLLGLGAGDSMWVAAVTLALFGVCVGGLDASMNMLGVSLQRAYGRSIMLGFHAAYSLGGIIGALLAWSGAHWHISLVSLYGPVVLVLIPLTLVASRWYRDAADPVEAGGQKETQQVVMRLLMPLCLVMAFAYIGDSTVSNWSAKYLQDTLHSSEQLSTVPYAVYMVTTLLGRSVGDFGVRRFGAVAVVRLGTVVAMAGFAVVAVAPGPWVGMLGFTLLGFGLCVIVPQTFAAAGRLFPGASDTAIARLNVFNYVGFLVGSPLVGALGDAWSYRGAMLVPMLLVGATLHYARSFAAEPAGYGVGHERPSTVDVG